MTREVSLDRFKRITLAKTTLALLTIALCSSSLAFVGAQYGGHAMQQYQYESDYGGGGGYGGGYDYGMDERPKLNLGIRLRIPAFRFELPRFSLPKITVSAKIRQPDKPRVITLPEINLDTTSKVEPPGGHGGGGSYGGGGSSYGGGGGGSSYGGEYKTSSSSYQQPSYGYGQEKAQTFTFSTAEETHPASYGNNYEHQQQQQQPQRQQQQHYGYSKPPPSPMQHAANQKQAGQYGAARPMQQQQHDGYRGGASVSRPTYTVYSQPPGGARFTQTVQSGQDVSAAKNPELGFSAPVYAATAEAPVAAAAEISAQ